MVFWKSFLALLRCLVKNAKKKKTFLKINVFFLVKCFIKLRCRRLQTVKNAKKTFLKINVFFLVKCFIKLRCRRLQTGLGILKNIKYLNFFKGQIFYAIFKNCIFP